MAKLQITEAQILGKVNITSISLDRTGEQYYIVVEMDAYGQADLGITGSSLIRQVEVTFYKAILNVNNVDSPEEIIVDDEVGFYDNLAYLDGADFRDWWDEVLEEDIDKNKVANYLSHRNFDGHIYFDNEFGGELGFKDGFYDSEVYMTVNDPVITDYINKVIKGENLVYSVFFNYKERRIPYNFDERETTALIKKIKNEIDECLQKRKPVDFHGCLLWLTYREITEGYTDNGKYEPEYAYYPNKQIYSAIRDIDYSNFTGTPENECRQYL